MAQSTTANRRKKARTIAQKIKKAGLLPIVKTAADLIPIIGESAPPRPGGVACWTFAETAVQMATVESLLLATYSGTAIAKTMRERYGLRPMRVTTLVARVREKWKVEDEAAQPAARAAAIRRLQTYVQQARGERFPESKGGGWRVKPDYPALFRFEALLADLQGTRMPTKVEVNVDVSVSVALQAVIASLTPDQMAERLAAARERRAKAERVDRYELSGPVQ